MVRKIFLTVDVKAGMANGDTIKFDQVADEAVGHTPGDLIFAIKQIPYKQFDRKGDDLYTTMQITLLDSLVGFKYNINHLDGHQVDVIVDGVSHCSKVVKIKGQGMPRKRKSSTSSSNHGDLYVELDIKYPKQLSENQKTQLKTALS